MSLQVGFMQVWGMLVEMRIGTVSGFDLSALNAFRWHPHHEKVDLSRQEASGHLPVDLLLI